jgi:uncharacterized membrane protein YkoI
MHRTWSASIFVLLAAASMGVWVLFWDPVASSAAPTTSNAGDVSAATAKLEELHQRAMARINDDDDDKQNGLSAGHAITPEMAASLAQQLARARGRASTKHHYLELQTRNGRPVYEVRIGTRSMYVDADSGDVAEQERS